MLRVSPVLRHRVLVSFISPASPVMLLLY